MGQATVFKINKKITNGKDCMRQFSPFNFFHDRELMVVVLALRSDSATPHLRRPLQTVVYMPCHC